MGHSAKVHKRMAKKTVTQPKSVAPPVPFVRSAKKRAGLKSKTKGTVLGGADYVTLMLGGRREAAEEARKLPQE